MRKLFLVLAISILLQILGFSVQGEAQAAEILIGQNFTGPFNTSQPIAEEDTDRERTRQIFTSTTGNLKAIEIFVANRFDPLALKIIGIVEGQATTLAGGISVPPLGNLTNCNDPEILRYEFDTPISLIPGNQYAFDVFQISPRDRPPVLCGNTNPNSYPLGVGYNGPFSEIGDYGFITYYEYDPLGFLYWLIPVVILVGSAGFFLKRRIYKGKN